MKTYVAKTVVAIDAPATKVWEALTTPAIIKKYLYGTEALSDWKEGSKIVWRGEWEGKPYEDKGEIVRLVPNKLLETTYLSAFSGKKDEPESYDTVTYELTEDQGQTVLTLTQGSVVSQDYANNAASNWQAVMHDLKNLLEK
jgi:uncharacterized protein YndB with AHSA1/START domain